jgi:hypothetical protein
LNFRVGDLPRGLDARPHDAQAQAEVVLATPDVRRWLDGFLTRALEGKV